MFQTLVIQPILNLLILFYKVFESVSIPYAFGFAIIALTVSIRLLFHPFFKQQFETQQKMAKLKPHMDELNKKYKDDKTRLQQAQMDLYKQHGINPTSGCLFALIQIPIFIGLYQTLNQFVEAGSSAKAIAGINQLLYTPALKLTQLDPRFFTFNLAESPATHKIIEFTMQHGFKVFSENMQYLPYMAIPFVTGILQYLQAKTSMPAPQAAKPGSKEAKEPSMSDDFQSAMNTQMKYFLPVMIGYFSYSLPLGLSLYWNIFSIFSILQGVGRAKRQSKSQEVDTDKPHLEAGHKHEHKQIKSA